MPHLNLNGDHMIVSFIVTLLGFGIHGFMYYFYLNKLKHINCNCVEDEHHEQIKKYFNITILTTILFYGTYVYLNEPSNVFVTVLFFISALSHIMLVYHVRHMLVHIRKYSCNCAETVLKEILDIINIIEMTYYIFFIIYIIFGSLLVSSQQQVNYNDEHQLIMQLLSNDNPGRSCRQRTNNGHAYIIQGHPGHRHGHRHRHGRRTLYF